jgi:ribosomal protein L30E
MPPKYTRIATDEDITKFLRLIKDGKVTEGSKDFLSWLKDKNSDQVLLAKEKKESIDYLLCSLIK